MPKISKNKPLKEIEDLMWKKLIEVFRDAHNNEAVEKILNDLFTPSEKIIFGKRLMIVLFLSRGLSYAQISNILKVSTSTIARVQNSIRRKGAGYSNVIEEVSKSGKLEQFFNHLDKMLSSMPRKSGGPRWKFLK